MMPELNKMYPDSFFRHRNSLLWRADMLCKPILDILQPRNLIDVGCAIGDFVQWFLAHGVDAYGIEGSAACLRHLVVPSDRISIIDMRQQFQWSPALPRFDLAMSIEVAEHIEPKYAETYVKHLTELSDNLLLTIAGPGQQGHHHVNLQPMECWDKQFGVFNYRRDIDIENKIKERLHGNISNRWISAIVRNLSYYTKIEP